MRRTSPLPGQRIVIIGSTGAGKTTLATHLAQRLQLPHVELDALHWDENWQPAPLEIFQMRVTDKLTGETWVTDGNYSKVRAIVWSRADTIVWLDYALTVVLWRLFRRTLRRTLTHEVLWNNNRESARTAFLSKDSLFLWALKTYKRRRSEYPTLLALPQYAHLTVIRLRSPQITAQWLSQIKQVPTP